MLSGSCIKKNDCVGWDNLGIFGGRELCDLIELEANGMLEMVIGLK